MTKPTIQQEISEFLKSWDCTKQVAFLRDIMPIFELYDVDQHADWLSNTIAEEDITAVRLVRTVYLISRIAEFHAGDLCLIKANFRNLYKKLEKVAALNT